MQNNKIETTVKTLKANRYILPILALAEIIGFIVLSITSCSAFLENYSNQSNKCRSSFTEFTDYLNDRIPVLMKTYNIPGASIAIISEGKHIWMKAYGYARPEEGKKMTSDTRCRVESISKSVTAWGVMKLVEKGVIALDTPVCHYITNWKFPGPGLFYEKITIRQLLSHCSGLPLGNITSLYPPIADIPSLRKALSVDAVLSDYPDSSFSYSNTGYNVLELMIEEVSDRSFSAFMKEEILIPLGMHNSSFNYETNLISNTPYGHTLQGKTVYDYVYPTKASGGLLSTAEDIAKFITDGMNRDNLHSNNLLNAKSINELYSPQVNDLGIYNLVFDFYGLGHFLEILPNGKKAVSHGGQGYGWMSHFTSVPETGDGIVLLTNSQRSWPFFAYILNDWTDWTGLPRMKMKRIIIAEKISWILIGSFFLISAMLFYKTLRKFRFKRLSLMLKIEKIRPLSLVQCIFGITVLIVLLWTSCQKYLFIYSILPISYKWIQYATLTLSLTILFSGLFTKKVSKI